MTYYLHELGFFFHHLFTCFVCTCVSTCAHISAMACVKESDDNLAHTVLSSSTNWVLVFKFQLSCLAASTVASEPSWCSRYGFYWEPFHLFYDLSLDLYFDLWDLNFVTCLHFVFWHKVSLWLPLNFDKTCFLSLPNGGLPRLQRRASQPNNIYLFFFFFS